MSIDISQKPESIREATATGIIELSDKSVNLVKANEVEKGDVYSSARLAAIQAVKQTPMNLFHCHPIPIYGVNFSWKIINNSIIVEVHVKSSGKTGCEMEALSGVSTSLLMIWDMIKMYEKDDNGQYPSTQISNIRVIAKIKKQIK